MNAVLPVIITTPDGVIREIRATFGARKRTQERFGTLDLQVALKEHGEMAMLELLHLMLYDKQGNPPNITIAELVEMTPYVPEDWGELSEKIVIAVNQGKKSPNETLALVEKQKHQSQSSTTTTGLTSEPSAELILDSQTPSSGTDSLSVRLTPSEEPTEIESSPAPV